MASSLRIIKNFLANHLWILSGVLLLSLTCCLVLLSKKFSPEIPISEQPVILLVLLLVSSSIIYLIIVRRISTLKKSKKIIAWTFAVGIILRLLMISSTPILEVDFNRYLWDGAVTANGLNPYKYSPYEIQNTEKTPGEIPQDYLELARESNGILGKINHSDLKTVYPPVTQIAFALAHMISPWDIIAWRFILLAVDVITLFLLFKIFRQLNLSVFWLIIYWWNPLLIKEIFNSAHMDVLIFPFIIGAVLVHLRNKRFSAIVLLAFAVGVKLWPVLLLPFFLKNKLLKPKELTLSIALFTMIVLALLAPVYLTGFDENSGFINYSERWQLNDAIFKLLVWGSQLGLGLFSIHPGFKFLTARYIVVILMVAWMFYLVLRKQESPKAFVDHCQWTIAALFFLIPTQFPWYFLWLLPLLTVRPRFSLLLLTATLPLYYLRYFFDSRGMVDIFDFGIVWIEYIPIWIFLGREIYYSTKKSPHFTTQFLTANEI